MKMFPLKRPLPADEGPDNESVIEEGHIAKKGRFEKFPSSAAEEGCEQVEHVVEAEDVEDKCLFENVTGMADDAVRDGEDVDETCHVGHGEKIWRLSKGDRIDLLDLPVEILRQIFPTGTSLQVAEQVSGKWRAKIESTPGLWKNACERLSLNEGTVTQQLRERLQSDSDKDRNKALVWRDIWRYYRKKVCQHCFSHTGSEYPLFDNIIMCTTCRKLEPYNAVTSFEARSLFGLHLAHTRKVMKEKNIALDSHAYGIPSNKVYKFAQLVGLAEIVYSEVVAVLIASKYRFLHRTEKMQGVHIREL